MVGTSTSIVQVSLTVALLVHVAFRPYSGLSLGPTVTTSTWLLYQVPRRSSSKRIL